MQTTHYCVTALRKRPLATFDTIDKAQDFRRDRAARGVGTRLFEIRTSEKEL